jgi:glycerol kinase
LIFESKGVDVVENQPVEIVDITDSQNRVVTVYFHQDTKLPVRQSIVWRDPKTHDRYEEVTRFARYQNAGGIQWPHQIMRERNGDKVYQIFSDSVSINRGVSDSAFAVPTGPAEPVKVKKK